jgi:HEPN domain-containing protein
MMDWQSEIRVEFEKAEQARARGNEGQARVCARRAAGIAAREYLSRRGERPRTSSAYDLLKRIAADPAVPANLKDSASRLTLRVDEQFRLPPGVDLLAVARAFCAALLPDPPGIS